MTKEARQGRKPTRVARVSAALWRRAWLRAALTLSPPLAWFLVIYLASLVVMLVTAFWTVNPFAYFMARVATSRVRNALFVAVLLPLWASYLARVYAWIVILTKDGTLDWTTEHLGLGSPNIA